MINHFAMIDYVDHEYPYTSMFMIFGVPTNQNNTFYAYDCDITSGTQELLPLNQTGKSLTS